MLLRKVVREKILEYFNSSDWLDVMEVLKRGRTVRHAHIYLDSILHPDSVRKVALGYLKAKGIPSERHPKLLSHGTGMMNVYYIQPPAMCHFELFLRYNQDVVIEPMAAEAARGNQSFDYWDDAFMARYYTNYAFKPIGAAEEEAVQQYFQSPAWREIYATMAYEDERHVHSHCIVETCLNPEDILPIGKAAIEKRGWIVDRAVSVVFGLQGHDQGKITYLLKEPEIVLELEWEFNPDVVIEPGAVPISRLRTTDMARRDMEGITYLQLNKDDLDWLNRAFEK